MRFRSSSYLLLTAPIFGGGKSLRSKFYHRQTSHILERYLKFSKILSSKKVCAKNNLILFSFMKYLIINADDFGYSKIFNDAILALVKNGLISSTTVMVNWITDEQSAQINQLVELTKSHNVSVGLHLEFSDDNFKFEIEKQYGKFFSLFGFKPSHIDIHKSTHLKEAIPIIIDFCKEKNLPCRNHGIGATNDVKTPNKVLSGTKMSFEELKSFIENLKDGESYEILFHPGTYDPDSKSSLNKERELDVKKIEEINPFLKENDIKLISYIDLVLM